MKHRCQTTHDRGSTHSSARGGGLAVMLLPGKQLVVGGRRTQPSEFGKEHLLGTGQGDVAKVGRLQASRSVTHGSHGCFVPLLLMLEAPGDVTVSQYCTMLLQGTGSARITPCRSQRQMLCWVMSI